MTSEGGTQQSPDVKAYIVEVYGAEPDKNVSTAIRDCERELYERLDADEIRTGRTTERLATKPSLGDWINEALPRTTTVVAMFLLVPVLWGAGLMLQPAALGAQIPAGASATPLGLTASLVFALLMAWWFEWIGANPIGTRRGEP